MRRKILCTLLLLFALTTSACGEPSDSGSKVINVTGSGQVTSGPSSSQVNNPSGQTHTTGSGNRGNTSVVLTPEATGSTQYTCQVATIDASNASQGYVMVEYTGDVQKVKLQINSPTGTTYNYNLTKGNGFETFPLLGSGKYTVGVLENASGNEYYRVLSESFEVTLENEFGPFLYPNQYVWFTPSSACVSKAAELVATSDTDLDAVATIFEYVVGNISYDYKLAESVASGYLPNPDHTLDCKTGICLDYASLMAAMLRSQNIPTRLEVGYAGTAYHAWISTYITDIGWVSGIIYFDGQNWSIMDPTFAANNSASAVKEFIGDGDNYSTKYIY